MRKKTKRHVHSLNLGDGTFAPKKSTSKNVSPNHKSVSRKELITVYNKFYKNQVAALYRAVHNAG